MKFVSYISVLGLIPFFLYHVKYLKDEFFILNFNIYYGFIIFGFLLGMQWLRTLETDRNIYEKLAPVLIISLIIVLINFDIKLKFVVIGALLLALMHEFFFQKQLLTNNYLLMRFIITFLAIYSFFI